eukprot:Polyplicarium_translucidae@DN2052_c0_g1_i2.p1
MLFLELTATLTASAGAIAAMTGPQFHESALVVPLGFISLVMTSYAGLELTFITDRLQGAVIFALLILVAAAIIVRVVPRLSSASWEKASSWDSRGFTAAAVLIISLANVEVMNQSTWQRIIAARSTKHARIGMLAGALAITPLIIIVGALGIVGLAGSIEGLFELEPGTEYLVYFTLLRLLPEGWLWVVVILVVGLAASSCDSIQSAATAVGAGVCRRLEVPPNWSRLGTAVLTIAAVIVACFNPPSVLTLLLLANVLCAAAQPLVFLGLWERVTPMGAVLGCCSGVLSILVVGWARLGTFKGGFQWFLFPLGFYTWDCLVTFIAAPFACAIVTIVVSQIEIYFDPNQVALQRHRLARMRTPDLSKDGTSMVTYSSSSIAGRPPPVGDTAVPPLADFPESLSDSSEFAHVGPA